MYTLSVPKFLCWDIFYPIVESLGGDWDTWVNGPDGELNCHFWAKGENPYFLF